MAKDTVIYIAQEDDLPYDTSRPEKELLRAVLQNALLDMNKPGEIGRKAREYFLNADEDYIFSFRSVCSYLNISPRRILVAAGLKNSEKGLDETDEEAEQGNAAHVAASVRVILE